MVDLTKLIDYCLNPEHIRGKHKARVFASALDFTVSDAGLLKELLLEAATQEDAEPAKQDDYGQRFIIDFEVQQGDKTAIVRSAWIIHPEESFPCLTTCYVL